MLALSDGVLAIIITLLVLEVHVPELDQGQSLNQALGELRPSLVWLNVLYLLPLCLLPFAAGLLGRYTGSRWRCGSTGCCWWRSRCCGW